MNKIELNDVPKPPVFDDSALPSQYRNNFGLYCSLRQRHLSDYATAYANSVAVAENENRKWTEAFDRAAALYCEKNPFDPIFTRNWPEGAEKYLGNAAYTEAIQILQL